MKSAFYDEEKCIIPPYKTYSSPITKKFISSNVLPTSYDQGLFELEYPPKKKKWIPE